MKTKKILATFAWLTAIMMAVTLTSCTKEDNSIVDKPTLGTTVTWDINTQGDAIVGAGEKWIIKGNGEQTIHRIIIGDGATVTLSNVNIEAFDVSARDFQPAITCQGDATIILADGTSNFLSGVPYPGIVVRTDKKIGTLTIKGTGSLEAISDNGAGIGCPYNDDKNFGVPLDCGNIVIESGTITAKGGQMAPGIGASGTNKCGNITIKGGNVTAIGAYGPGIGCTDRGSVCGDILITGGIVTALTGDNSTEYPGIGSSWEGRCGNITITNKVTKVTATGGRKATCSIGRDSEYTHCGTITIGGIVYFDGGSYQNGGETYLATNPFVYAPSSE